MQQNIQDPSGYPYGVNQPQYQQNPYQHPQYQQPYGAPNYQQAPYAQQPPMYNQTYAPPQGAYDAQHPYYPGANYNNAGYDDIEAQNYAGVPPDKLLTADVDIAIRNGFVRKVYGILGAQLCVTFVIAACFNIWDDAAKWLYHNPYLLIIAAVALMGSVCTLACVPSAARRSPLNYMLMGLIAVCMGITLGFSTGAVDTVAFTVAAGMTAVVTLAVSLFACQTKYDFTGCGVYAFVGLIILMIFGLTCMFWHNKIAHLAYASMGAALFSFYIIMDTQMIVGGKHRAYQYSIDDYCFAALTLYLDIINLFMYILQIVAASRDN